MRSTSAISDGAGNLRIEDVELDAPGPGEVLVAIKASGVCHTDYDFHTQRPGLKVLGHEGAGVVQEVGDGVTQFSAGDRVLLNWAIPCGRCTLCSHGHQNICDHKPEVPLMRSQFNREGIARAFRLGTMATHTVVREEALNLLDVAIPFPSASIIGCGVMTGVGSVWNTAKVPPGASVVVIGTGGVGLNCLQAARIAGASRIIAIDVNEKRLALARTFGATDTLLAQRDDNGLRQIAQEVAQLTGNGGADFAFEATAVPALGAAPLAMIRNGGTAVQVSGIEEEILFDMRLFEWDKTYINPKYGGCTPNLDFPRILQHYTDGQLKLDELVTRTYALEELPLAFDDMLSGKNAKGVITFP